MAFYYEWGNYDTRENGVGDQACAESNDDEYEEGI